MRFWLILVPLVAGCGRPPVVEAPVERKPPDRQIERKPPDREKILSKVDDNIPPGTPPAGVRIMEPQWKPPKPESDR